MRPRPYRNPGPGPIGQLLRFAQEAIFEALDKRFLLPRIHDSLSAKHALDPQIYSEMDQGDVDAVATRIAEAAGQRTLVAIHFWGPVEKTKGQRKSAFASFLLSHPTEKPIVVSFRINADRETSGEEFAAWAASHLITVARVGDRWSWHSLKSRDPREIIVPHPVKSAWSWGKQMSGLLQEMSWLAVGALERKIEAEDDRRVRRGGSVVRSVREQEIARLKALLPEGFVARAAALGESLVLDQAAEESRKKANKARDALDASTAPCGTGAGPQPAKRSPSRL